MSAKRLSSSLSISTSTSGPISMDRATAATSMDEMLWWNTLYCAAVWNTTKANSPPWASSRVNTGRSRQGSFSTRARV